MVEHNSPTPEAEAAIQATMKLTYRRTYLQLFANILLLLTTLTVALAPIFLAFSEGSWRLILLWLIYPAIVVIQNIFRSNPNSSSFTWGLTLVIAWLVICWLSSGPSWFLFVFIGLCVGNHLIFLEIPSIQKKLDRITESDGWKSAENYLAHLKESKSDQS